MNISQIKSFLDSVTPSIKQQSQGNLGQSKRLPDGAIESAAHLSANVSNSQQIGSRVLSRALHENVRFREQVPPPLLEQQKTEATKQSFFDFEEIAKNVLHYVSGVIINAQQKGASDEELQDLFGQARRGVANGIKMAEEELGDLLSDDVRKGIDNSKSLITKGIDDLEARIFNPQQPAEAIVSSMAAESDVQTPLTIFTRQGDEVTIHFESTDLVNQPSQFASAENRQSLQFSVHGDLSDNKRQAIRQLVDETQGLAARFFEDDVQGAYSRALELGYSQQGIASSALQMFGNQQQTTQAYQQVADYAEQNSNLQGVKQQIRPIADYLETMLNVMQRSQASLQSVEDYENLVNGLINRMGDVHTPDLISAVNRFHGFNRELMDNLPAQQQQE